MRHFYFLSTFFLFFFTQNSFAQLTNGTKSLGGYGGISASIFKSVESAASSSSSHSFSIGATPSYAFFKNNFLLGGSVGNGLGIYGFKNESSTGSQSNKTLDYSYNISPSVRYYLKNSNKLAYFVFADATYYGTVSRRKLQIGNQASYTSNEDDFSWRVGVGGHKVINQNFVAEGVFYYENKGNIGFSAGLRHFYQSLDRKKQETPPQYIAKNRWQVAASMNANNNFKDKTNNIGFYFSGGKMLDNHFMVGSGVSLSFSGITHSFYTSFSLSPFVRYYMPISIRLFAYPYIGATANRYSKNSSSIQFNRGIGFQYFMTQNLAITCTTNGYFSHNKDSYSRTSANGTMSFGFDYFMK